MDAHRGDGHSDNRNVSAAPCERKVFQVSKYLQLDALIRAIVLYTTHAIDVPILL